MNFVKKTAKLAVIAIIAYALLSGYQSEAISTKSAPSETGYKVERVVDGDTFLISFEGEDTYVRLIGVDTPESVHKDSSRNTKWGKRASTYTTKRLTNQRVYLEFDKEQYDQYGRLLAYVYLDSAKKKMYNKELVKQGYARAAYYKPNGAHKKEFEKLQKKAKKEKRGFWKDGYKSAFPK